MDLKSKRFFKMLAFAICILSIPLIAMQFTNEVNWTFFDFLFAGFLLFLTAISIEFVFQKIKNRRIKILICFMILIMLLLIWAELAVGIFGTVFSGS